MVLRFQSRESPLEEDAARLEDLGLRRVPARRAFLLSDLVRGCSADNGRAGVLGVALPLFPFGRVADWPLGPQREERLLAVQTLRASRRRCFRTAVS